MRQGLLIAIAVSFFAIELVCMHDSRVPHLREARSSCSRCWDTGLRWSGWCQRMPKNAFNQFGVKLFARSC